jgi:type I restriction enzyme S subunit
MPSRAYLKDLCVLVCDCPHSTPVWTESGVLVLRSHNIRRGRLDLGDPSYTDEHHYRDRTRRAAPAPLDLVITREAPMGEVCMLPEGVRCCLGQRMVLLRPDQNKVVPRYLLYALQSPTVQHAILVNEGTGSTVSNLRIPLLEALEIPYHEHSHQQAIATILGSLDDKIDLNRRLSETLEGMAAAMFRVTFANGEAQAAPGTTLGDLVSLEKGLSYKGAHLAAAGTPMINLGSFGGRGRLKPDNTKYYSGDYRPKHLVAAGDLVVANTDITQTRTVLGSPAVVPPYLGAEVLFTHHVYALRFKTKDSPWRSFVYYRLLQDDFRERAAGFATGTTVLALPKDAVLGLPVTLPTEEKVSKFHESVQSLWRRQWAAYEESRTLASLRDLLLPRLISGELRIKDAEKMVEAAPV